jgi:diaminopimelate epimerase
LQSKLNSSKSNKKEVVNKMTKRIKFTKMQGAGNDYVYVNTLIYNITNPSFVAEQWSTYHFGIGSDGLVFNR